jgi:N-acetylmuramoyl-L-alanine amidase
MMLEGLLPHEFTRLGWVLAHALWQGLVLAGLLASALRLARHKSSAFRHRLALGALLAWLAAPTLTYLSLGEDGARELAAAGIAATQVPVEAATFDLAAPDATAGWPDVLAPSWAPAVAAGRLARMAAPVAPRPDAFLPLAAAAWMLASAYLVLRLLASLLLAARLGRGARPLPELQAQLDGLADRLGVDRRVLVRVSARVDAPTVLGDRRPLVLLPRHTLTDLDPEQLELVLAHELAHVKRRDGTTNLLLASAGALLPFHPFTAWLASVMRLEREQACDDLALALTGREPVMLAQTLARLEVARHAPLPVLGIGGSGQLVRRVRRLLGERPAGASPWRALPFVGVSLLALWLATGAAQPGPQLDDAGPSVTIDVGHGDGTGAFGYVSEDEVVLAVALKVARLLEADGVAVTLTRRADHRPAETPTEDLARRLEAAAGSDLLVSLHAGSASSPSLRGLQTWIPGLTPEATLTERHHASRAAAEVVHQALLTATGAVDRGIQASHSAILENAAVPAMMIELGYVTHPVEGPRLADAGYQEALAEALAAGIQDYLARAAEVSQASSLAPTGATTYTKVLSYAQLREARQQE